MGAVKDHIPSTAPETGVFMKQHYVEMVALASIIPLGIYITNALMIKYPNITFFICLLCSALLGLLVVTVLFTLSINIGNFIKAVYFKVHSYSLFPLVLFPFYFWRDTKSQKLHIRFLFDWSAVFRDFYPADFINNYKDKSIDLTGTNLCKLSLKIRAVSRIIFMFVFGMFIAILLKSFLIGLFVLLMVCFLYCIAKLNTKYYHGEFQKCKNIDNNNLVLYLTKELCIYGFDNHKFYKDFNLWITTVKSNEFDNFIASVVKHMCVDEANSKTPIIGDNVNKYINENIISHENISMGLYDESWELLKAYLLLSIIKNDETELNFIVQELRYLRAELGSYLEKFYDMINYYINLGTGNVDLKTKKYPLIASRDRFCVIAPDYKSKAIKMESLAIEYSFH